MNLKYESLNKPLSLMFTTKLVLRAYLHNAHVFSRFMLTATQILLYVCKGLVGSPYDITIKYNSEK